MTHTTNFNLSQWAKSDRIQRADFNADNAKLDAALAVRSCQLYTTTYTGNGVSVSLNFPHQPVAVFVIGKEPFSLFQWFHGASKALSSTGNGNEYVPVTCAGSTVSWEGEGPYELNEAGVAHIVVAPLDANS